MHTTSTTFAPAGLTQVKPVPGVEKTCTSGALFPIASARSLGVMVLSTAAVTIDPGRGPSVLVRTNSDRSSRMSSCGEVKDDWAIDQPLVLSQVLVEPGAEIRVHSVLSIVRTSAAPMYQTLDILIHLPGIYREPLQQP